MTLTAAETGATAAKYQWFREISGVIYNLGYTTANTYVDTYPNATAVEYPVRALRANNTLIGNDYHYVYVE